MKVLVVGASGMLGQAFLSEFKKKDVSVLGLSRRGPDIFYDIINEYRLTTIIKDSCPDLVVNCAGIVSLKKCEDDPLSAYKVNSSAVQEIVEGCSLIKAGLIHISTDHYYTGDGQKLHSESDKVTLLNKYAETKYAAEESAILYDGSLIVRTNVTGFRNEKRNLTFIEWLIETMQKRRDLTLFKDFYTSTIDAESLSKMCIDAFHTGYRGILNIASSQCLSKKEFALLLASKLDINLNWTKDGSIKNILPVRAESLGLDCALAEKLLSIKMPDAHKVIDSLLKSQ